MSTSSSRKFFKFQVRSIDFSEDEFIPSSVGKSKNGHSKKVEEKVAEKLKPVKADDFFASMAPAVKLPKIPKLPKKGDARKH